MTPKQAAGEAVERVYVRVVEGEEWPDVYHTDPGCGHLQRADAARGVDRGELPAESSECQLCQEGGGSGPPGGERNLHECPICGLLVNHHLPRHLRSDECEG